MEKTILLQQLIISEPSKWFQRANVELYLKTRSSKSFGVDVPGHEIFRIMTGQSFYRIEDKKLRMALFAETKKVLRNQIRSKNNGYRKVKIYDSDSLFISPMLETMWNKACRQTKILSREQLKGFMRINFEAYNEEKVHDKLAVEIISLKNVFEVLADLQENKPLTCPRITWLYKEQINFIDAELKVNNIISKYIE